MFFRHCGLSKIPSSLPVKEQRWHKKFLTWFCIKIHWCVIQRHIYLNLICTLSPNIIFILLDHISIFLYEEILCIFVQKYTVQCFNIYTLTLYPGDGVPLTLEQKAGLNVEGRSSLTAGAVLVWWRRGIMAANREDFDAWADPSGAGLCLRSGVWLGSGVVLIVTNSSEISPTSCSTLFFSGLHSRVCSFLSLVNIATLLRASAMAASLLLRMSGFHQSGTSSRSPVMFVSWFTPGVLGVLSLWPSLIRPSMNSVTIVIFSSLDFLQW